MGCSQFGFQKPGGFLFFKSSYLSLKYDNTCSYFFKEMLLFFSIINTKSAIVGGFFWPSSNNFGDIVLKLCIKVPTSNP